MGAQLEEVWALGFCLQFDGNRKLLKAAKASRQGVKEQEAWIIKDILTVLNIQHLVTGILLLFGCYFLCVCVVVLC